jgi:hypothetical protein
MGFTPREVDQMTQWEFMAAWEGWLFANGPQDEQRPEAPSPEAHRQAMAEAR